MYASIAVIPELVELPGRSGFGFGGSAIAAGLFMLPTAAVQLARRTVYRADRAAARLAGTAPGGDGVRARRLRGAVRRRTRRRSSCSGATIILGLGLGLGLSSLANLIVAAVRQDQTGVATGVNTVMRTLGGAFGAQLATTCITGSVHHGLPTDDGFTLAFGICAGALIVGVVTSLLIPRVENSVSPMRVVVGARAARPAR